MKRLLLVLPLILVVLSAAAIAALNAGLLNGFVTRQLEKSTGSKVQLSQIQLQIKWPINLKFGRGQIEKDSLKAQWNAVRLVVGRITPPYDIDLTLEQPVVTLPTKAAGNEVQPQPQSSKPEATGLNKPKKPIHLKLAVKDGQVHAGRFQITSLNASFVQKRLLNSAAAFRIEAVVEDQDLAIKLPVLIDGPNVTLTPDTIKGEQLNTTIAGLKADLRGGSLLADDRHRWKVVIAADDLAKVPTPPSFKLAKNWSGALNFSAELIKEGAGRPWQLDAEIDARKVAADVDYVKFGASLQGRFTADLQATVQYHGVALVIPKIIGQIEWPQAKVAYGGWIEPGSVVPLSLQFSGRGDAAGVEFDKLQLQLWNLVAVAGGKIGLASPWTAKVSVEVKPLLLSGLEKILTPLKKSVVKGELALKAAVDGPLGQPTRAHILISELKLKDFSAVADTDSHPLYKVRGPVSGSIEAQAEIMASTVKSAMLRGLVNLKDAALVLQSLRKEAAQEMSLRFDLRNVGDKLNVQTFELKSFFGNVTANGQVSNIFDPAVDLSFSFDPLLLNEVRIGFPPFRDMVPPGRASGKIRIVGRLDTKAEWFNWPLTITGGIQADLPRYEVASGGGGSSPSVAVGTTAGATGPRPSASTSLLPQGRLTSALALDLNVQVAQLVSGELVVKGVKTVGRLASGKFNGTVGIAEIFAGAIDLKGLEVPVFSARPQIQGQLIWKNLKIEELLTFAKPSAKDFAVGRTLGLADFQTLLPSDEAFMESLKLKGRAVLQPVTFSTIKLGQMINDLISKVPGLKVSPAKVEPLTGQMEVEFGLASMVLQIEKLKGQDVDGSEINLAGKVVLTKMEGDLIGDFHWAKPTLTGCLLEGNLDAKGRMTVPLAMRGNLLKPELAMLNDMVGPLAEKALKCEAKKFLEKAKTDGREKVEDEIKKRLKGLFGK